jgi:hypothetical protein
MFYRSAYCVMCYSDLTWISVRLFSQSPLAQAVYCGYVRRNFLDRVLQNSSLIGKKWLFCHEDLRESGSEVLCFPSLAHECS